ncbi:hypothetical protein [Aquimarina mytili]|uniref:DUF4249 family protein n=1 Tax=Aquimarina mytili TaxID=874423 RepID=A0A937DBG9_9FLAO|nr:hypothetical protein [Aquimarina mytili]MBL0683816.1 hypothetical protein [Aquimarina mytili]
MNRIILVSTLMISLMFLSCSKNFPVDTSVKVLILNPAKDSMNIHVNNELIRSVTAKLGHIYLGENEYDFSITKNGKEVNKLILDIDSDEADRSSYDSEHITLINTNPTNDFVLIDCSAAYTEGKEYTIKEKYIDQSIIKSDYITYEYFRMGWQKLPDNLFGYGDLSIYKLFYIPEEYVAKSDKEILEYCIANGLYN